MLSLRSQAWNIFWILPSVGSGQTSAGSGQSPSGVGVLAMVSAPAVGGELCWCGRRAPPGASWTDKVLVLPAAAGTRACSSANTSPPRPPVRSAAPDDPAPVRRGTADVAMPPGGGRRKPDGKIVCGIDGCCRELHRPIVVFCQSKPIEITIN